MVSFYTHSVPSKICYSGLEECSLLNCGRQPRGPIVPALLLQFRGTLHSVGHWWPCLENARMWMGLGGDGGVPPQFHLWSSLCKWGGRWSFTPGHHPPSCHHPDWCNLHQSSPTHHTPSSHGGWRFPTEESVSLSKDLAFKRRVNHAKLCLSWSLLSLLPPPISPFSSLLYLSLRISITPPPPFRPS